MPPRQNPKYCAPQTHFQKRPPSTPAPAYSAPLQSTPPSSPVTLNMPLPSLPPYSTLGLEYPTSCLFPLEGPSSQPTLLPTFRANHPSPRPAMFPLIRDRRPRQPPQPWRPLHNQPPRRRLYFSHETLLLAVLLILQLAVLVTLGTVLTHSDWRRCGGGLELSTPSTGPEGAVSQASSDKSQLITPEP